jgi:hypothetical protein
MNSLLAVSILIPVHHQNQLEQKLQYLKLQTEEKLLSQFTDIQAAPVLNRLRHVVKNLDYKTHKRGIAIFVSTISEKVYYLDNEVQEKIDIEEFLEIKDELVTKKAPHKAHYHYVA